MLKRPFLDHFHTLSAHNCRPSLDPELLSILRASWTKSGLGSDTERVLFLLTGEYYQSCKFLPEFHASAVQLHRSSVSPKMLHKASRLHGDKGQMNLPSPQSLKLRNSINLSSESVNTNPQQRFSILSSLLSRSVVPASISVALCSSQARKGRAVCGNLCGV